MTTTRTERTRGEDLLRTLGEHLDEDRQPLVYEGGVVMPGRASPSVSTAGEEGDGHVERQAEPRRSETGSREGTSRRGASEGEGPTGAAAPIVGDPGLTPDAECDLRAAADAYPQMRIAPAAGVAWLQTWVRPVPGIQTSAYLLTQHPFDQRYPVRSWAWWGSGVWIGPRHTNYPHGDICAYDPKDLTWRRGASLVVLLDLHVVWVVRHLHLRRCGRWPGRQVVHTVYERLREQRLGELCGCGSTERYEACCRPGDVQVDPIPALRKHLNRVGTSRRRPPIRPGRFPSLDELRRPTTP